MKAFFRDLLSYFFSKKDDNIDQKLKEQQHQIIELALKNPDNAYLTGYATYQALYADQEEKSTYYKNINRILLLLVFLFAFLFAAVSCSSTVKPYVVGVSENGQVFDMNSSVNTTRVKDLIPKLEVNYAQDYVKQAFTVSIDGNVLRRDMATTIAMSRGLALARIKKEYAENPPKQIAQKYVVSVKINSIYRSEASPNTFDLIWTETKVDAKTLKVKSNYQYKGELTFGWDTHAEESLVSKYNPLGFYVDDFTYSKLVN